MSNKKTEEKRRMIYEIQTLGKKLLAQNGGKDIPFTCVDGRGKENIGKYDKR